MSLPISDGVMGRLDGFWAALGVHLRDSRHRASLVMYMLGLLSEQRHKSVESMASQFAADAYGVDRVHQKLLHFLSVAPWPDLALSLLSRALLAGVPPGVVLADAAYGDNAEFREELARLKLHYAVAIGLSTTVQLVQSEPETTSVQALLDRIKMRPFRRYAWRKGPPRELTACSAFFAVRIPKSDSEKTRWLILERRDGSASSVRAYLSNRRATRRAKSSSTCAKSAGATRG